jgi:hypothetical protein
VLGVRGSGNEHAAAHAKERGVGSLLGDEMQKRSETDRVYRRCRADAAMDMGITINQSSGSERTDVAAAAVSDLWRKLRFDGGSSHVLDFRGRGSRVPTTVPPPRPREVCAYYFLVPTLVQFVERLRCYLYQYTSRRSNQPPRRFSEIIKYNPLALTASMQHITPNPRLQPSSPLPPLPPSHSPILPLMPPPL